MLADVRTTTSLTCVRLPDFATLRRGSSSRKVRRRQADQSQSGQRRTPGTSGPEVTASDRAGARGNDRQLTVAPGLRKSGPAAPLVCPARLPRSHRFPPAESPSKSRLRGGVPVASWSGMTTIALPAPRVLDPPPSRRVRVATAAGLWAVAARRWADRRAAGAGRRAGRRRRPVAARHRLDVRPRAKAGGIGGLLVLWLYLCAVPGRTRRDWIVAETVAVLILILTCSLATGAGQDPGRRLGSPAGRPGTRRRRHLARRVRPGAGCVDAAAPVDHDRAPGGVLSPSSRSSSSPSSAPGSCSAIGRGYGSSPFTSISARS